MITKKKVVVVSIVLIVVCAIFVSSRVFFKTWNPAKAFDIWKTVVIDDKDYYLIKKGMYVGGDQNDSNVGYVFFDDDLSKEDVMNKLGYYDFGNTYTSPSGKEYIELSSENELESAIIYSNLHFIGGKVLEYKIVGVC